MWVGAGRVPVKVSTENGSIEVGDALTSASSTPGAAMKATGSGKILGYALEPFDATSTETILAFINLQERGGGDLTVFENGNGEIEVETLTSKGTVTLFAIDEAGALVVGKLKAQELCVGSVCVTEEDFIRVFGAEAGSAVEEILESSTSSSEVCQNGANRPCSSDVGACQIGVEICENGVWGECIGAVMPADEICDEVDNDCDDQIDEEGICTVPEPEPEPEPIITTSTEPIIEVPQTTTTDETATTTE